MDQQADQVEARPRPDFEVEERAADGAITKMRILGRVVEMADLLTYVKKNCNQCMSKGWYGREGKRELCSCPVRQYVKKHRAGLAAEQRPEQEVAAEQAEQLTPDPAAHNPSPEVELILQGKNTLLMAGGFDEARPPTRHERQVVLLEAELFKAQVRLDDVRVWASAQREPHAEARRVARFNLLAHQELMKIQPARLVAAQMYVLNHQARLRIIKQAVLDVERDLAAAEQAVKIQIEKGNAAQETERELQRADAQAGLEVELAERACMPQFRKVQKEVEKVERRLAAARMRAGIQQEES